MPRSWDPADATRLLTAVTFAGLGGFWTLFYSYWIRDKGFGMAHYVGRITGPITGEPEAIPTAGFVPTGPGLEELVPWHRSMFWDIGVGVGEILLLP
jgi:hypothetical protein